MSAINKDRGKLRLTPTEQRQLRALALAVAALLALVIFLVTRNIR